MIFLTKKAFRTGAFVAGLGTPFMINAQVLVHQEPIHRPVFQNQQIRILNVLLPAGDTTQYHIHHTPSVFIYFSNTTVISQLKDSAPSTSRSVAGNIIFENLAAPNLRIHKVFNIDSVFLHVMDVELLIKDSGFTSPPLADPVWTLLIDTSWVRAYKAELKPNDRLALKNGSKSLLLISLSNVTVQITDHRKRQVQTLAKGAFFSIAKGQIFSLKNIHHYPARFALLEMP